MKDQTSSTSQLFSKLSLLSVPILSSLKASTSQRLTGRRAAPTQNRLVFTYPPIEVFVGTADLAGLFSSEFVEVDFFWGIRGRRCLLNSDLSCPIEWEKVFCTSIDFWGPISTLSFVFFLEITVSTAQRRKGREKGKRG